MIHTLLVKVCKNDASYYNALDVSLCVCFIIKLAPCRDLAQDVSCQFRDWADMFLEWRRSPSCLMAEEHASFFPRAKTPFWVLLQDSFKAFKVFIRINQ